MKTISFLVRLLVVSLCSLTMAHAQQPEGWVTADGSNLPDIQASESGYSPLPVPPPPLNFSGIFPTSNYVVAVGNEADVATVEIIELARELDFNPEKIFNWVRDNITYFHYYGVKKGAALTLEERSGNDADTCALLVSLLRQCATVTSASYVNGYTFMPLTEAVGVPNMADWLGVDPDPALTDRVILGKGTPRSDITSFQWNDKHWYTMKRWWVRVVTAAGVADYDPSFKLYQRTSGVDLVAASGYSRNALLTALGGATTGGKIEGANKTAAETKLKTNAAALTEWVRANLPNEGLKALLGELRMVALTATFSGDQHFPLLSDPNEMVISSALAQSQFSTVRVRAGSLDLTLEFAKLRGRTLWMRLQPQAVLYLDDEIIGTEVTMPNAMQLEFRLDLDHFGTDFDQSITPKMLPRKGVRVLSYGVHVTSETLRKHQRILEQLRGTASNPDSDRVKAEAMCVMGAGWMAQTEGIRKIIQTFTNTSSDFIHRFGFVADEHDAATQKGSYYVDFPLHMSYTTLRTWTGDRVNGLPTWAILSSAMEHAVIAQMQDGDQSASAIGIIAGYRSYLDKLYLANSSNWWTVRADLIGYSATDLAVIESTVLQGGTAFIPISGKNILGSWSGAGYLLQKATTGDGQAFNALITGGYKGSFAALLEEINLIVAEYAAQLNSESRNSTAETHEPVTGGDPVNMSTGQFVQETKDLVIGDGVPPTGFTFSRSYDGANRYINSGKLGAGWSHSFNISANPSSDMELASGNGSAVNSAAFVLGVYTVYDLFKNRSTVKDWTLAAISANYAANRLVNNVVCVQLPDRVLKFHRLPGGEYDSQGRELDPLVKNTKFQSPPGVAATLSSAGFYEVVPDWLNPGRTQTIYRGEKFLLEERHGRTWELFRNQLIKVTDTDGRWASELAPTAFDQRWRIFQDCYGRKLRLNYDTSWNLISVTDWTGRRVSFSIVGGLLKTVTDVMGKKTYFSYDTEKRMTKIQNHALATIVENTTFDSQHRVIEQISQGDPLRKWRYYYQPGQTIEENPLGQRTTHLFDDQKRNIGTINALGHFVQKEYDGQDHLVKVTSPMGYQATSIYNLDHTVSSSTDALNKVTSMTYDSQKRLITTTSPTGQQTTINAYNNQHHPLTLTDAAGIVTGYTYSDKSLPAKGELTSIKVNGLTKETRWYWSDGNLFQIYKGLDHAIYGEYAILSCSYTSLGDVETCSDANFAFTSYEYNARRQVTKMTQNPGLVTTYTYNDNGDLETVTNPRGYSTKTLYNVLRKPVETILPDDSRTQIGYDLADRLITVKNALNQTITRTLDAAGQATHVTDPLSRTTVTTYDPDGRVETVIDALTRLSRTIYNARGEVQSQIQPDALGIGKTYDDAGRLLTLTNRSGNTWTFGYDTAGRQITSTSPMGLTQQTAYESQGRLSKITEPSGDNRVLVYHPEYEEITKTQLFAATNLSTTPTEEIAYTYDRQSLPLTVTDSSGTIIREYTADPRHLVKKYQLGTHAFSYAHDANGNQTQLTQPDGKTITYAYDNRDRLTTITDWAGRVTTLVWDVGSRLTSVTRPNGTVRTCFYDGASQMTRIEERTSAGRLIQMVRLGLDAVGRAEKRLTVPLPVAATFPALSLKYNKDNWINGKNYDPDGNMLQVPAVPAPTGQVSLGAQPGILNTTGNTNNATWDLRNRLTSLSLADATTLAFTYDAENLRLTKTRGTSTTRYIHNAHGISGMSECTIEKLPGGSQRLYVWGGPAGLLYDVSIPANSTTETLRYYHSDQVGSTMALTNQSGTVIGRADYTPYGLITLRSGDTDTPFLYNGAFGVMTDSETGLVHMRARYYHPWLARFINADPSGFGGGMNMFAFANGNPIMLLDALGLDAQSGGSYLSDVLDAILYYSYSDLADQTQGAVAYTGEGVAELAQLVSDIVNLPFEATGTDPMALGPMVGGSEAAAVNGLRNAASYIRALTAYSRGAKTIASGAESVNAGAALRSKLSALEDAQAGATTTRILPDGRIRYYGAETAARTPGPTRGASYVTEQNPATGGVRSWMESYNQAGSVNRVHPKMINGQQVNSQHYPPTARELGQ